MKRDKETTSEVENAGRSSSGASNMVGTAKTGGRLHDAL